MFFFVSSNLIFLSFHLIFCLPFHFSVLFTIITSPTRTIAHTYLQPLVHSQELEAIEDQWRGESRDLLALVNQLQDENRRLQRQAASSTSSSAVDVPAAGHSASPSPTHTGKPNEAQIMTNLTLQLEKQREDIKLKDRELISQAREIEQMTAQVERLKHAAKETKKRQKMLQSQIRNLCEERADFLAQIQDQHREILSLKQKLGIVVKENEDLLSSKDEDDKPRFTTAELKEVLTERNELKHRVNDLLEELASFKPIDLTPKPEESETATAVEAHEEDDEDRPVQGPLPCDPEDAPWKKSTDSDTGIRKFFRKLFSEGNNSSESLFQRRSLSTISKMALSSGSNSNIAV